MHQVPKKQRKFFFSKSNPKLFSATFSLIRAHYKIRTLYFSIKNNEDQQITIYVTKKLFKIFFYSLIHNNTDILLETFDLKILSIK